MRELKCPTWRIEPDEIDLGRVLQWCLRHRSVTHGLVALRLEDNKRNGPVLCVEAARVLERELGESIVEKLYVSGWPGTKLMDGVGLVYVFRLDQVVMGKLVHLGPSLEDWVHDSGLPEDICALRKGDDLPALVTVTHEGDAWLVSESAVDLPGVYLENEDDTELLRYIFSGSWFCHWLRVG